MNATSTETLPSNPAPKDVTPPSPPPSWVQSTVATGRKTKGQRWRLGIVGGIFVAVIVLAIIGNNLPPSFGYEAEAVGDGTTAPAIKVIFRTVAHADVELAGHYTQADDQGNGQLMIPAADLTPGVMDLTAQVTAPNGRTATSPVRLDVPEFSLYLSLSRSGWSLRDGMYHEEVTVETEPGADVALRGSPLTTDGGLSLLEIPLEPESEDPMTVEIVAVTRDGRRTAKTVEIPPLRSVPIKLDETVFSEILYEKLVSVRGLTLPGAVVNVSGKSITAEPDGTFKVDLSFPEETDYDLEFVASLSGASIEPTTLARRVIRRFSPVPIHIKADPSAPTTALSVDIHVSTVSGARVTLVTEDTELGTHTVNGETVVFTYAFERGYEGTVQFEARVTHPEYQENFETIHVRRRMEDDERREIAKEQFIEKVDFDLTPKHLDKNPDRYSGERVALSGKIFQIGETGYTTWMLVNTENLGHGIWSSPVVYVTVNSRTNLVEGDVIRIYGVVKGSFAYKTRIGGTNSVPHVEFKYTR